MFSVLKFVLTCAGPHHNKVEAEVTALIEAHCDISAAMLKEDQTISSLQEKAMVTAIAQSGVGKGLSGYGVCWIYNMGLYIQFLYCIYFIAWFQ